jgi:hypothetical protein
MTNVSGANRRFGLPAYSDKALRNAIAALGSADPSEPIGEWLKQRRFGDIPTKHLVSVLRFFAVLPDSGDFEMQRIHLSSRLLRSRNDRELFAKEVEHLAKFGYVRRGCSEESVACIGQSPPKWGRQEEDLRKEVPFQKLEPGSLKNALRFARHIHNWLLKEKGLLERQVVGPEEIREAPPDNRATRSSLGSPCLTTPLALDGHTFVPAQEEPYRVHRDNVYAHVYFEARGGAVFRLPSEFGPEHADWFENLALRLQEEADRLRGKVSS